MGGRNSTPVESRNDDEEVALNHVEKTIKVHANEDFFIITPGNFHNYLDTRTGGDKKKDQLELLCGEEEASPGFLAFGEAVRTSDVKGMERFFGEVGESRGFSAAFEDFFSFKITVQKPKGTIEDSKLEKAAISVTALQLAIIGVQDKIVDILLDKLFQSGEETVMRILSKVLTKITFEKEKDREQHSEDARILNGLTAFHVASRYNANALRLMLDHIMPQKDDVSLFPLLKDGFSDHSHSQTLMHMAARNRDHNSLRILLDIGLDINMPDANGFTALHVASNNSQTTNVHLLLDRRANPSAKGADDLTPLHVARSVNVVKRLMQRGTDQYALATIRGNDGKIKKKTAFEVLLDHNPSAAAELFFHGIRTNDQDIQDRDLLLVYDLTLFRLVSQGEDCNEMSAHSMMLDLNLPDQLHNPLAEAFLHMKYEMTKGFFYCNVALQALLACLFTALTFITARITQNCRKSGNMTVTDVDEKITLSMSSCLDDYTAPSMVILFWVLFSSSALGTFGLMVREFLQAKENFRQYCRENENLLEFLLVLGVAGFTMLLFVNEDIAQHLGAWGVLFTWLDLTLVIGRFRSMGIYIYMAMHVMRLMLPIFFVYSPALLGFAFTYHLLLPNNEAFASPVMASLKILSMMTGEFDLEGNFLWSKVAENVGRNGSTQVIFVVFVFLVGLTISNLILGLTVNKTEELAEEATVIRLTKSVLQVIGAENIILKPDKSSHKKNGANRNTKRGCCTIYRILPQQLFDYLDSLAPEKIDRVNRICVQPNAVKRYSLSGKDTSKLDKMEKLYEGRTYPIYIFDENVNGRGKKLKISLSGSIVLTTLELIHNRSPPILPLEFEESTGKIIDD